MQCTKCIVRGARCIPSCSKRLSLYLPSIVHHIILPHHWQPQFYNDVSSSILGMAQFKIWISHDSGKPCRMHAPTRHESTCPECPPHPHYHHHPFLKYIQTWDLTTCDAIIWNFAMHFSEDLMLTHQPPAYKAGLAVRHTIDFSIGTGKSQDWHEIANSLGYEIWNGQFYGLGNKRKAIFDVKLLDWLVPQNSYLYR